MIGQVVKVRLALSGFHEQRSRASVDDLRAWEMSVCPQCLLLRCGMGRWFVSFARVADTHQLNDQKKISTLVGVLSGC